MMSFASAVQLSELTVESPSPGTVIEIRSAPAADAALADTKRHGRRPRCGDGGTARSRWPAASRSPTCCCGSRSSAAAATSNTLARSTRSSSAAPPTDRRVSPERPRRGGRADLRCRACRAGPPTDAELLAAHRAGDGGRSTSSPPARGAAVGRRAAHAGPPRGRRGRRAGGPRGGATGGPHTYRGDAAVRTWLHRIVVNACIDRIRHEQVRRTVPWPRARPCRGAAHRPGHRAGHPPGRRGRARELPDEQRVAVVLVDVQGWSRRRGGAILGVPAGTVKSRCARGRARLAVLLGHLQGGGPDERAERRARPPATTLAARMADASTPACVDGRRPARPRCWPARAELARSAARRAPPTRWPPRARSWPRPAPAVPLPAGRPRGGRRWWRRAARGSPAAGRSDRRGRRTSPARRAWPRRPPPPWSWRRRPRRVVASGAVPPSGRRSPGRRPRWPRRLATRDVLDAGELADPARRAGCLRAVGADRSARRAAARRPAWSLDGRPGVLLVLATGPLGGLHGVVVVDPGCGPAGPAHRPLTTGCHTAE